MDENHVVSWVGKSKIAQFVSKCIAPHESYVEAATQYGKSDVRLAMATCVLLFMVFIVIGMAYLGRITEHTIGTMMTGDLLYFALSLGVLCLILRQKWPGLAALGIQKQRLGKSLVLGCIVAAVIVLAHIVLHVSLRSHGTLVGANGHGVNIPLFLLLVLPRNAMYTLIERLTFTSIVGPRLYGVMKHKFLSIFLTGILFAVAHVFVTPLNFIIVAFYVFMHFLLHWLHTKYNHIAAPWLVHFVWNSTMAFFF